MTNGTSTRADTGRGTVGLALRPSCECCDRALPPDSREAFICSFECTFCRECAEGRLAGRCPNCGGELVRRPEIDVVNLVAGNLDKPGGSAFGSLGLPGQRWVNIAMGGTL